MPCDLLLIGWDLDDWKLVTPMLEQGGLPNLQKLLQRGTTGNLMGDTLPDRSTAWTTLLTGKRLAKHRVLGDLEPSVERDRFQRVTRRARQTQALWNVAALGGRSAHCVNFPATYPAESIANGVNVSDYFFQEAQFDSVHPRDLFAELQPLIVRPEEIDEKTIAELLGPLTSVSQEQADRFRRFMARAATTQAVVTRSLEHQRCDVVAVRFEGLKNPRPENHFEGRAATFLDLCLGRLLDLAGAKAHVVFVVIPTQKSNGFMLLAGPGIKAAHSLGQTAVENILPTILAILDIAIGADFDGRPCKDAFHTPPETKSCASWEPCGSVFEDTPPDDSAVAHLLALGYRDQPDLHADLAIGRWKQEQQFRLAVAHIEAGDPSRALPLLEELVRLHPRSVPYRSKLAEACFRAGDLNRAKALIEALRADGIDSPLGRAALAAIAIQQRDQKSALIHLDAAPQLPVAPPQVLEIMGRLYLRLRKLDRAGELFTQAIGMQPDLPSAHDGLGLADLLVGKFESAEKHIRRAIVLLPQESQSHQHLAMLLIKSGRLVEALGALRTAESISPGDAAIHRRLASVLEKTGDHAAAIQHRWLARQHAAVRRQFAGSFDTAPPARS